jgi:hypothetical protein
LIEEDLIEGESIRIERSIWFFKGGVVPKSREKMSKLALNRHELMVGYAGQRFGQMTSLRGQRGIK